MALSPTAGWFDNPGTDLFTLREVSNLIWRPAAAELMDLQLRTILPFILSYRPS